MDSGSCLDGMVSESKTWHDARISSDNRTAQSQNYDFTLCDYKGRFKFPYLPILLHFHRDHGDSVGIDPERNQ